MSKIQNRLSELQPYVIGVRFFQGASVVDAIFKKGWHVPQSDVIISEKVEEEESNHYIFLSQDEKIGLDEILDYIEQIIALNIEREKKHELLKVKAKELQELFRKNPLSKLQNMKFVLGGEKLVEDMDDDPEDVVEAMINEPLTETPTPQPVPRPQPVAQPTPQPVPNAQPTPQPVPQAQPVNEANVRRAPNGEIIPPLTPEDKGELKEEFQKFDLTNEDEEIPVSRTVKGQNVDLPPKKTDEKKIQLLEIEEPQDVICKCGPEEVCPACEEEKIGHY